MNASTPEAEVAVVGRDADIVLVDDDPVIAALVKRMLAKHEYGLAWFPDGVAAIAALCPSTAWLQVKLILLDVAIPGLDGFGERHYCNAKACSTSHGSSCSLQAPPRTT